MLLKTTFQGCVVTGYAGTTNFGNTYTVNNEGDFSILSNKVLGLPNLIVQINGMITVSNKYIKDITISVDCSNKDSILYATTGPDVTTYNKPDPWSCGKSLTVPVGTTGFILVMLPDDASSSTY